MIKLKSEIVIPQKHFIGFMLMTFTILEKSLPMMSCLKSSIIATQRYKDIDIEVSVKTFLDTNLDVNSGI